MRRTTFAAAAAGLLLVTARLGAQQHAVGTLAMTSDSRALSSVDRTVSQMTRAGDLVLLRTERDPLVAGLEHERYQQRHLGIPVWGTTVVRQLTDRGEAVSLFGSLYSPEATVASPRITADVATAVVERAAGVHLGASRRFRRCAPRRSRQRVTCMATAVRPCARSPRPGTRSACSERTT